MTNVEVGSREFSGFARIKCVLRLAEDVPGERIRKRPDPWEV